MRRLPLFLLVVGTTLTWLEPTSAQEKNYKPVLVIFKDGFTIKGRVREPKEFFVDPASGVSVPLANANALLYVDDGARRIIFSPHPSQVQDVLAIDHEKDLVKLTKRGVLAKGFSLLPGWEFEGYTDWSSRWERTAHVNTSRGRIEMDQRITLLTPYQVRVEALKFNWMPSYLTREFEPDLVHRLLTSYFVEQKDMKEPDKREKIARFMIQAGWLEQAEREVKKMSETFPARKDILGPLQDTLKVARAGGLLDEVERASKVGQHELAQRLLDRLLQDEMAEAIKPDRLLQMRDLKNKYETAQTKLKEAARYLQEFPRRLLPGTRGLLQGPCDTIVTELHLDTVGRLDTFLDYAQQHDRQIKQKGQVSQKTDEVLALALSGWLQGDNVAAPDVDAARALWKTRDVLAQHYKEPNELARKQLADAVTSQRDKLPVDVTARMIPLLPPPEPYNVDKVTNPIKVSDALVQLPPEYHHQRAYPVLFVLHASNERASDMMDRWSELAERHGFILAAIPWGRGVRATYQYSAREHTLVLECLRDLRRRFNVDSDRVFLFGREEGGSMALDIGLAHPDQFAGVMVMNASPSYFPSRCWSNAQYLPVYMVEGSLSGINCKANRALFKEWIRSQYATLYFEYKDRPGERFEAEFANMFDWMSRKKRAQPAKELGRYHTGGGTGEEFKTMRAADNQFYWLSAEGISARCLNNAPPAWNPRTLPATLQASIRTGNEIDLKKEGVVKGVRIWNQINLRTAGIDRVTVWLGPNMIDFTKPVQLRVNRSAPVQVNVNASLATLLERLYQDGDRQRLFYAKIDVQP
jgi:pimeloyl-ACP methyl ester carboxylesterase